MCTSGAVRERQNHPRAPPAPFLRPAGEPRPAFTRRRISATLSVFRPCWLLRIAATSNWPCGLLSISATLSLAGLVGFVRLRPVVTLSSFWPCGLYFLLPGFPPRTCHGGVHTCKTSEAPGSPSSRCERKAFDRGHPPRPRLALISIILGSSIFWGMIFFL